MQEIISSHFWHYLFIFDNWNFGFKYIDFQDSDPEGLPDPNTIYTWGKCACMKDVAVGHDQWTYD